MANSRTSTDDWSVYIVRCADGSLYTGIARSLSKRISEHNSGILGAKYTRSRRPVTLAYTEGYNSRSAASKREAVIKKMNKSEKEALVSGKKRVNSNRKS